MKISLRKTLTICTLFLISAQHAQAGNWSLGASIMVTPNPYRGHQDRILPVPSINYVSDDFYFRTLIVGYNLWKEKNNQLSIFALYSPLSYRPSQSDDIRMQKLNERRSTMMAGISYSHHATWGSVRTTLSGDTLNNSNGFVGDISYLRMFGSAPWRITPGVGMIWNSGKQNRYYYGINAEESRRSSFETYAPSDSWSPYLELTVNYRINSHWSAFFTGRYIRLVNEVKNSPMIDKVYSGLLWTGVTYNF